MTSTSGSEQRRGSILRIFNRSGMSYASASAAVSRSGVYVTCNVISNQLAITW